MKTLFTTVVLLLSTLFSAFAQAPSWQWGKRGGTNTTNTDEYITDIATDPNGNVYVLSSVRYNNGGSLDVAGNAITGKGAFDVLLSSFTCSGTYRWSRVFGGLASDYPAHLQTDTLGGIYFTARFNNWNASVELASDTTLSVQSGRSLFLVKYDTAGNYKWVARPQSDTTSVGDNSNSFGLQIDGGGNVYWLAHLLPNSYGNGAYQVNGYSLNVLKYNKNGVFQGGVPMDIVSNTFPTYYQNIYFTRNHKNGKMYISGHAKPLSTTPFSFGSTNITKWMFLGAFSSTGSSLWTKQSAFDVSQSKNSGMDKVSIDDSGNIYVPANCSHGDSFASSGAILNTIAGIQELAFLAKLDSNGNLKWLRSSSNGNSYSQDCKGTLTSDGKFVLTGGLLGTMSWTGLNSSITSSSGGNGSLDFFIARFDAATGQPLNLDTLSSINPTINQPDYAHADRKGNVYLGGRMEYGVVVGNDSLKAAGSTKTDFFLAKYGYANCNCVVPVAAITQSNYNNADRSAVFQYTGTTAGIDSIVFTWGNGQRLRLTGNYNGAITRYYGTDTGTYNVCVTVYTNGCGTNTACTTVHFTPLGVGQLSTAGGAIMALAPNPASGVVQVAYSLVGTAGSLEVYDLAGRLLTTKVLRQKTGTETVLLTDLAAGVYMVVLREEGRVMQQQRLVVAK